MATVWSWNFAIGAAWGGFAFAVGLSADVRDHAFTLLIAEAAIGLVITAAAFAGLARFATFMEGGYRRVLEVAGGVRRWVLPYVVVGLVSGATAIFATVAAIATPAASAVVQAALLGVSTLLCCWAIAGCATLVLVTRRHAEARARFARGGARAAVGRRAGARRPRLGAPAPALVAIVAEGFLSRLSFGLVSFALPLFAYRELGLGIGAIGVLLSFNLIVAIALKPAMGALADRFGLKRSLTAAIALRSVVAGLYALAAGPWQLFAIRGAHGVSIAVRDPAVNALIAERGGKHAIASAFAWYQTAKSVAGAAGKLAAGVLLGLTASNFTLVFGVACALSLLPLVIVLRYLTGDQPALVIVAAEPAERPAARAPGPRIAPFMGLGFLISGTAYMLANLFPVFAVEYAGLTEAQTGAIYALAVLATLTGPIFGWLSDHVSRRLVLSVRSFANVASSLLYLLLPNFAGAASGRILDDVGKAAFKPAWGALMAHVSGYDRRRRARTMGYLSTGEDAGEIAGPILAGILWTAFGVPVLLTVRIALAIITEIWTIALTRSLHRLERPEPTRAAEPQEGPQRGEPDRTAVTS